MEILYGALDSEMMFALTDFVLIFNSAVLLYFVKSARPTYPILIHFNIIAFP